MTPSNEHLQAQILVLFEMVKALKAILANR